MDVAAILAKIVGVVLLFFTIRSVYKHFKGKMVKKSGDDRSVSEPDGKREHPLVEQALNTLLLYVWFVFMTAFSLGLVVNN